MPKYLSKQTRKKDGLNFVLTDRDVEILQALNRCRYLRTNQIKRLVFSENKTLQSTRRRLKYLFHNKFVGRVMPFIQVGHGGAETAYYLDRLGIELLKEYEEPIYSYSRKNQVRHQFLNHALDLSEFRINMEIALKDHPIVEIHRFTCDFELKEHTAKVTGRNIFKLYDQITHPVNRQNYVVYPDALIVLKGKGEYEQFRKMFFLEVDRGTEQLSIIRDKVIGYNLYHKNKIFNKFGKADSFTVLFQTSSEKRANNIRKYLTDQEGTELVWITNVQQVDEKSIVSAPIWQDYQLERKAILKNTE